MKLINKRDFAIKISGNHYFACDYVFSNIYGESVFFDENDRLPPSDLTGFITEELNEECLKDTLPESPYDALSTLPDCTKEVEYMTEGSVLDASDDELYIRYGSDEAPMCIHIRADGSVTLSGDENDVAEIVFEEGKRNFIALPQNVFTEEEAPAPSDAYEMHAPLHLCVSTDTIDNRMTSTGGTLKVSYSIEVNGILAEVTDFTITADTIHG